MPSDRLSRYDAIFYFTSTRRVPMQVTVGILVDGPVNFDRYLEWVTPRIDRMPVLKMRLKPAPLHLRLPAWVTADNFEMRHHVLSHDLPDPGDETALSMFVSERMHRQLPPDRPLWQLHVISGLENNRTALVLCTHHCMADAEGIWEIFDVLFDSSRCDELSSDPSSHKLADRATRNVRATQNSGDKPSTGRRERLRELFRYAVARSPRFPYARPVSGQTNIAWGDVSVEAVRMIGRAFNATATDVLLSAFGAAMDADATRRGVSVDKTNFLIQVPANVRTRDRYGQLGNELAMLPCVVPLGIADPVERLRCVADYNRKLKTLDMATMVHGLMGRTFALATPPGQALMCKTMISKPYLQLARMLGLPPREHALASSVLVPSLDFAIDGQQISTFINLVKCQFNMGIVFSPVTYEDKVTLAFSTDAQHFGSADQVLIDTLSEIDSLQSRAEQNGDSSA